MSDLEKRSSEKRGKSGKGGSVNDGDNGKKGDTGGDHSKNYEVGYGKPPLHSRFKPGESGNPKGKPVDKLNMNTMIEKMLFAPIPIQQNGKTSTVPAIEAILLKMRNNALAGDFRSALQAIRLASQVANPDAPDGQAETLPLDPKMLADLMRDYLDHNIDAPDNRPASGNDRMDEEHD